jgi:hypothetical protein
MLAEGTVVACGWTAMVGKVRRRLTGELSLTVGPSRCASRALKSISK